MSYAPLWDINAVPVDNNADTNREDVAQGTNSSTGMSVPLRASPYSTLGFSTRTTAIIAGAEDGNNDYSLKILDTYLMAEEDR